MTNLLGSLSEFTCPIGFDTDVNAAAAAHAGEADSAGAYVWGGVGHGVIFNSIILLGW